MRFFCFIFLIFSFNSFHLSAQICSGPGATAQTAQAVCATQNFPQQFIPPCTDDVLPPITGNSCPAGDNLIPAGVYVLTVAGMSKDFKRVEVKGTVNLLQ